MFRRYFIVGWRTIQESKWGSACLGTLISALCGLAFSKFSVDILNDYGLVLFLGVPFFCGFTSVFIYSYREDKPTWNALGVSTLSIVLLGVLITAFAIDGFICIIMAAPLAFVISMLGGGCAQLLTHLFRDKSNPMIALAISVVCMPLLMGFEANLHLEPPIRKVVTSVDIDASPGDVWKLVVAFPPIPEPKEWLFKTGIAYPLNARIEGKGVGAVRYCNFSTGPFIEPIRVWDEPHLLRFDVTHNPSPMKEWSFYRHLQPTHLHNFMVSKQGQFKLKRLSATRTRLEGTTWYSHRLWPVGYWGVISDSIIHKIHYRVLSHIKTRAERSPA